MKNLLSMRISHNLSKTHWLLLLSIVAFYEFYAFGLQCDEAPVGVIWGVVVATVFVVLWARHVTLNPIGTILALIKYVASCLLDFFLLLLMLCIFAVPLVLVVPLWECNGPRTKLAELIGASSGVRDEVEKNIINGNVAIGSGAKLEIGKLKDLLFGTVTTEGVVVLLNP